ncbi:MAG TPA: carbohydrate kinase family protein [Candidatus Hydrogenedentes bacterium]|nr:carbohydrate kinase family protein [Candidatus Hydrogenedentota bacterium]HPG66317.1 carbohydrate kinase family protein [Candidatus Hydrogenedentota bacterium]
MAADLISLGIVCADVMVRPVDRVPERGKLGLVPNIEMHVGGLAGVTALVFSQLGGRSAFIGKLGQDGFGDYIFHAFDGAGVDVSHVRRSADHGTSATVVLVSADGERTFLHHLGANADLGEEDVHFDFVKEGKILHWGGPSVTPKLDGEPIGRVFQRARALGVKTSMDTCFDGTNIWFPRIEHALPHLDVVMSSIEEAQRYTGQNTPEAIADFYLSFGPEVAMIKLGQDGVYVKGRGESHRIPAHTVTPVDTTGAGDAACAGFLYGYLEGWDLEQCGRLANAVGGLTVQHMGGAEAIQSLSATMAFMEQGG